MNFFKVISCLLVIFALISVNFSESVDDGKYIFHNFTEVDADEMGVDENSTIFPVFSSSKDNEDIYVMGCFLPTKEELISIADSITVIEGVSEGANISNSTYLDLSEDMHFPPVGDQGQIGSCASWAIVYYANSYLQAKIHNYDLKGSDSLKCFNPLWAYNKINNGENEGSGLISNLKLISRLGSATYETMPETDNYTIWGEEDAWLESPQYRISGFEVSSTNNTEVMKSWLNEGSVIIIAIHGQDLYPFKNRSDIILSDFEQSHEAANHAQTVIGYDDSISENNETGAFKVMNSWGSEWCPSGDGSYYITYKAMENLNYTECWRISGAVYNDSDSNPELIGVVRFNPENKGTKNQNMTFGIGNESNISGYVDIYDGVDGNGGNGSMPDFIAFDLTDWKSEFDESLENNGKGYYFANFLNGAETSVISEFGIINYVTYPEIEINTVNSYLCNNSTVFKFYSETAPEIINSNVNVLDNEVTVSINAEDIEDDLWGVNVYFDGSNEYYSLNGTNETFNGSFDKQMFSYGEHYAIFEAFDGSGNINENEKVVFEISAPVTIERVRNHYNSDLSSGITSSVIKNAISNSDVVYGSEIDAGYAEQLRETLQNGNNYELTKDTIIVGGPLSNPFADKYDSEFDIKITNDNPGENRGVIQVKTIEVRDGNIIKTYQVIYIAGSDRFGTLAALEYFKTLVELPEGPIIVE